jgi:hypothetical protein
MFTSTQEVYNIANIRAQCLDLAEVIGVYRWHGWSIPDAIIEAWEAVLDGTYLESLGYGYLADDVAEEALRQRHDAYYNHTESECSAHEQWHADEDDLIFDVRFLD